MHTLVKQTKKPKQYPSKIQVFLIHKKIDIPEINESTIILPFKNT